MERKIQCHLYLFSPELYLSSKVSCWCVHLTLLYVAVKAQHIATEEHILLLYTLTDSTAIQSDAKICYLNIIPGFCKPFCSGIVSHP